MSLCYSSNGQCFTTPQQGGSLTDSFIIEENLDLEELMKNTIKLSLEIYKAIPKCTTIIHNQKNIEICITSSVQECLEVGGSFEPANMEMFLSSPPDLQAMTWLTNLQATPKMEYCHYTQSGRPELVTEATCKAALEEISGSLQVTNNFIADDENISRLVLMKSKLEKIPTTFKGSVLCQNTPQLQATTALASSLLKKLKKLFNNIKEAYELINSSDLNTLLTSFETCGEEEFKFGDYSKEMSTCIEKSLATVLTREKRASVVSYLLGDGSSIDRLQNNMNHLEQTFDHDVRSIAANEMNLKFSQQLTQNKLSILSTSQRRDTMSAISNHWSLAQKVLIEEASTLKSTAYVLLFANVEDVKAKLLLNLQLLSSILLHQNKIDCTEINHQFGCVNIRYSTVHISKNKIAMGLHFSQLLNKPLVHITCVPENQTLISSLHGHHGFIKNGELHTADIVISEQDLKNRKIVNKITRKLIDTTDLFQNNLLLLEDQSRIGFWCRKPMFVIYESKRINCTSQTKWETAMNSDIVSANGIIKKNAHENLKLKSKQRFALTSAFVNQEIDTSNFLRLNENTSLAFTESVLQKLSTMSPIQTAYISLGSGTAVILLLILAICCCKYRKTLGRMCGKPASVRPLQAEAGHEGNRQTGPTVQPLSAEEVALRTRQAFRDYIGRRQTNTRSQV